LIVVIPGIAAFVLEADIAKPDAAYPWVLTNYVTVGFKGLAFAALIAAIGSSLSSMVNSASTIFTLDIYRPMAGKGEDDASQRHLVRVGKITAGLSLVIGVIVAPVLGNLDQAFQYIQEYTGFISPGVVVVFLFGMFWKRASSLGALVVVLASIPMSVIFKFGTPNLPFMDRMGISFLLLSALMIIISLVINKDKADEHAIKYEKSLFKTSPQFNMATMAIIVILSIIYAVWW